MNKLSKSKEDKLQRDTLFFHDKIEIALSSACEGKIKRGKLDLLSLYDIAFLIKICVFIENKKYQKAEDFIRPLDEEVFETIPISISRLFFRN